MRTHLSPDSITRTTLDRRSRPRVTGVLLATLLLFVLAQPLDSAHGQLLSPASAAPRAEVTLAPGEVPVVWPALQTDPSPVVASSASEATTGGHHATVVGIPIPLALAVGAVMLVLAILLAITTLTRHRHDDDLRMPTRKAQPWLDRDPLS